LRVFPLSFAHERAPTRDVLGGPLGRDILREQRTPATPVARGLRWGPGIPERRGRPTRSSLIRGNFPILRRSPGARALPRVDADDAVTR